MSDVNTCKKLLVRYTRARIPFIAINTIERNRTLEVLEDVAREINMNFWVHTLSKGIYDLTTKNEINDSKFVLGAIDYTSEQMTRRKYLTLILTETSDITTDNADSRQLLELVTLADEMGGTVIVLTNHPVWNRLQRFGMVLKLDTPNEEEMYQIIKEYIDDYRNEIPVSWDDKDVQEASTLLTGVTRIEAENVIAALIANGQIDKNDIDEVRNAKDRLFSDISGLEKIDVDDSVLEVGGLEGLRKWLNEKKMLLSLEKRMAMKRKGLQPPRGILLVGVPGCGKSLSAKSIAANWKLPLYRLDFATVQGSYVGQSEAQLNEALSTAENVSPCVLWIDEIEKGLSGSGGDNNVSTRMVGQFLFWLQECKKPVFVVATANDVSMLPSELLRRGRFDELFFVDLPTEQERKEILSLYMRKYLSISFNGNFAEKIIEITEGFTGADLESTVRELSYRVLANDEYKLTENNIIDAFNNVIPLSQMSPEKIEDIREWGKARAIPASGKPIGSQAINQIEKNTKVRKILF